MGCTWPSTRLSFCRTPSTFIRSFNRDRERASAEWQPRRRPARAGQVGARRDVVEEVPPDVGVRPAQSVRVQRRAAWAQPYKPAAAVSVLRWRKCSQGECGDAIGLEPTGGQWGVRDEQAADRTAGERESRASGDIRDRGSLALLGLCATSSGQRIEKCICGVCVCGVYVGVLCGWCECVNVGGDGFGAVLKQRAGQPETRRRCSRGCVCVILRQESTGSSRGSPPPTCKRGRSRN